jgi:hypothetical protein
VTCCARAPPRRFVQLPDMDQVKEASEGWKPSTHEEPAHQLDPRTTFLIRRRARSTRSLTDPFGTNTVERIRIENERPGEPKSSLSQLSSTLTREHSIDAPLLGFLSVSDSSSGPACAPVRLSEGGRGGRFNVHCLAFVAWHCVPVSTS